MFSDIPNDRLLRRDENHGGPSASFAGRPRFANGNTLMPRARLITCEHGSRSVSPTELDGSLTVLADRFEGKRFNSPNDAVVARDGALWFTDPAYGVDSDYQGHRAEGEIGGCHVYRLAAGARECHKVADDFQRPNGLAFSPDGASCTCPTARHGHCACRGRARWRALGRRGLRNLHGGVVRWAARGRGRWRVWVAAGDGVHCFDPDGTLLGKILVPEEVANVVFGGAQRNRLFIAASTSLYSIRLATSGVPPPYVNV